MISGADVCLPRAAVAMAAHRLEQHLVQRANGGDLTAADIATAFAVHRSLLGLTAEHVMVAMLRGARGEGTPAAGKDDGRDFCGSAEQVV